MARTTTNNNLPPIIDAYQRWIQNCLAGDGSIFSSASLWTTATVAEVKKAFVDNPDLGDESFEDKLKGQMKNASPAAQKLMAEMLWALLVFPVNITPPKKRERIRYFWSLSGEILPETHPMLSDEILDGIGSGGQAYLIHFWRELTFLIEVTTALKHLQQSQRQQLLSNYEQFVDWLAKIPGADARQFRHMLRYAAFPDRIERIASNTHRIEILEAFDVATKKQTRNWTDRQLDDALFELRRRLEKEYPGQVLDFYEPPLVEKWQSDAHPSVSFGVADCNVFSRYPASVNWAQVSKPDQDLFKNIRERLKKLAEALAAGGTAPLPLKAETSHPTPNGRSPKEIWCCVYPESVPNKSYGLQVALIISERGAEVCFCQGSGTSQVDDLAKKHEFEGILDTARERLGAVPREIIKSVEAEQKRKWFYRKSWLQKPNEGEFTSLAEWLRYASTPNGSSASVSAFFSPSELQDLGPKIFDMFSEALETFSPILSAVYLTSPSPKHWVFQGNPNYFDIDSYLNSRAEIRWQVSQHASEIKPGDKALIWRSGENAGVIAECSVESEPSTLIEEDAPEFYVSKPKSGEPTPRCKLRVLVQYPNHPIPRAKIKEALPNLLIIKAPQGTNFPLSAAEYAQILALRAQDKSTPFSQLLRRYYDERIVFSSSVHKVRYAITSWDQNGVSVERLDANEPQRVTFAQAEKLIRHVKDAGTMPFTTLDDTSAVRNTVLQAEPLALTADKTQIKFLGDPELRLENFLNALGNLNMANPLYKPAMLLCVLDGIDQGELTENQISFDWIAPRFIAKMKSLGKDVTEQQAAQPFYHLSGDLIWLHAVPNLKDLMQDGGEGPTAARKKIKYALLKDTYWALLQDPESHRQVRQTLEDLIVPKYSPDVLLPAADQAIKDTGFFFTPATLRRFVGSLATKPFVILTGNSGTGKTKLAELFAQWLCGDARHRFALVPVGADWTDNRNVLGFVNHLRPTTPKGESAEVPIYQSTEILNLLLAAKNDPARPFFLVLDEMNLSHVERYFADFLSTLESLDGHLLLHREGRDLPRKPGGLADVPSVLPLPRNVFVIGTVNVDETTYMFSPKVLDRANVIEFRMDQTISKAFLAGNGHRLATITPAPAGYAQSFLELSNRARQLKGSPLSLINEPKKQPGAVQAGLEDCRKTLADLFALMRHRHQEFAFRTMAEILSFLAVDYELTTDKDKWDWQSAMDTQVLQKILPKLHGSKRKIGSLLVALATYCEKENNYPAAEEVLKNEPKAETYAAAEDKRASSPRFQESHRKLCEMIEAVRRDQFVSYIQ